MIESDIELDLNFGELEYQQGCDVEEKLQRTEKWFLDRSKCYTGSKGKTIMACGRGGTSLTWNDKEKINNFSDGIITYIYEVIMARHTGRYLESASTSEMRYGTAVEALIEKRAQSLLPKDEIINEIGFQEFPNRPHAGASADGVVTKFDEVIAVVENKACTSWGTHFKRTYEYTDESSIDFWQMQMEMIAHNVKKCYYFVSSPPNDIMKYLKYEGDILDLYDDFCKETEIHMQVVNKSEIHCEALLQRIDILEAVTESGVKILNEGGKLNLKELLIDAIQGVKSIVVKENVKYEENLDDLPF